MALHSPMILKKFRKTPSFVHYRDVYDSNEPAPSPSFRAKFDAGEEQQFKREWGRLQEAVNDLYRSFKKVLKNGEGYRMPNGTLAVLHDDVHVLIRSKAGSFVYDFIQKRILPLATQILFEDIVESAITRKKFLDVPHQPTNHRLSLPSTPKPKEIHFNDLHVLVKAWKYFHSYILPHLEMIFSQVKSYSENTIRTAGIVAFRDGIIIEIEDELINLLKNHLQIKDLLPSIRQMMLVLQSVCETYPPTENRLRLENLVPLVVSPYQGYKGLYKNYSNKPVVVSNELSVAHLRRLSVVDPRKLSRPLSTNSNKPLETLQDLFALSADRTRNHHKLKNGIKEGRKRSVSTSEEF